MKKPIDPMEVLRRRVAQSPTQTAAARALGVSKAYLSDILNHQRPLGDKMLARLSLKRIVVEQ